MQKIKEKVSIRMIQIITLSVVCLIGCDAGGSSIKNNDRLLEKKLYQTWILVEKNINNIKELLPTDDLYPITLTFYSEKDFRGRHDANSYKGIFEINENTVSFSFDFVTDCGDIDWYWHYVSELLQMEKALIFQQDNDTTNVQLKLSNQENSITLFFINKKWFEETHFKLEEWYD